MDNLPCYECGDGRGWTVEPDPHTGDDIQFQWCHDFRDKWLERALPDLVRFTNQVAARAYAAGQAGEPLPDFEVHVPIETEELPF